ncbi:hypothetical protein Acav_2071 [Paracidovorax avenae ATCC 19860]|uniref:DUF676 domain-containing protein n=1 Tax=Paracidovorax avenae (strain ATCC 19860 / DSM 7227 / CCUG 15838 / JCM 20985 / LMG 2117 / NCPPB 1011) TaxID=643561 RepID=F0Q9R8_PARA1|nr:hypothetical protein [Paracidovorax avenae]ADX45983.1 hypothetical protein Acav_2071 [Paracidovorax avenae ATCC 19860]
MANTNDSINWPIIYVRGFAFSASERDATAADPYCGFNVGSTVYRATVDKEKAKSFFFESPLVRLASDHGYKVLYRDGLEIADPAWTSGAEGERRAAEGIDLASIIVHRFYDAGSNLRGGGKSSSIVDYAKELGILIARVRELVRPKAEKSLAGYTDEQFKCYLVAHSMGGLIVRALLQDPGNDVSEIDFSGQRRKVSPVRSCVAKVFTYATPHNGIEFAGVNVPEFLKDVSNFNREKMQAYLNNAPIDGKVNYLPADIIPPPSHWFTMVGTNRLDYDVAAGLSRTFVGRGSDGLVRIDNAKLWYQEARTDSATLRDMPVACAYAYRAHSGPFGIVNSEEAYQCLRRFLFGNFRVELWLDIHDVRLPLDVQKQEWQGRKVDAIYQVELVAAPRGKSWALSRRKSEEDSPACRTYQEIKKGVSEPIHLSTVFLMNSAKVQPDRPGLSYAVTLGIKVPDYEVERAFWRDGHYEGVSLFNDSLIVTIFDPKAHSEEINTVTSDWLVRYSWAKRQNNARIAPAERGSEKVFPVNEISKPFSLDIPLHTDDMHGGIGAISATLRMEARAWS